jgi:hypothetical protein
MNSQVYKVDMFYDSYESDFGDGFYPMTKSSEPCTTKTTIGFLLITETDSNVYWKQTKNSNVIKGLDGNEGILLFAHLNNQLRVDNNNTFVKGIVNANDKIIYPKNT